MGQDVLRIEKLENGYEVEVCDPKIEEENRKPSKKGAIAEWKSPWKAYAFSTSEEVVSFVAKHLSNLPKSSQEEFDSAANEAFKDD